jgi:hypothetical protein
VRGKVLIRFFEGLGGCVASFIPVAIGAHMCYGWVDGGGRAGQHPAWAGLPGGAGYGWCEVGGRLIPDLKLPCGVGTAGSQRIPVRHRIWVPGSERLRTRRDDCVGICPGGSKPGIVSVDSSLRLRGVTVHDNGCGMYPGNRCSRTVKVMLLRETIRARD